MLNRYEFLSELNVTFDGKPLSELTDTEKDTLIQHLVLSINHAQNESQQLERINQGLIDALRNTRS